MRINKSLKTFEENFEELKRWNKNIDEVDYCYCDERMTLPLTLLPHVFPISKNSKISPPTFASPEKSIVSFFIRKCILPVS
jgi:hypothetical protein